MPFFVFLLVNATLFIRPGDLIPDLALWPIYNVLMLTCLVLSITPVLRQLNRQSLAERPVSAFVVCILGTICLSTAVTLDRELVQTQATNFFKVLIYYFCLIAVVNTPGKLRAFLGWLVAFIMVLTTLALLQYHGQIDIPALASLERYDDGDSGLTLVTQLRSLGMFNDPNDLCLLLVVGIMISLYFLLDRKTGMFRIFWLAPIITLAYAVILTKSRGGLLAVLGGMFALFVSRFGWKRSIPLIMLAFPAMLLSVGGRQSQLSVGTGTAQERIMLWSEGLHMIMRSPKWAIFGIGAGRYDSEMTQVAHNSYVHAFVEMGFLGGTVFLGVFYIIIKTLYRLGTSGSDLLTPELKNLRPFLLAAISGYGVGMFSLSRCYIVPTYMMLGLATVYFHVAVAYDAVPRFNRSMLKEVSIVAVGFLIFIQIFIRIAMLRG